MDKTINKIFHLSSCTTCKRIIKELQQYTSFSMQDIKTEPITPDQLDTMRAQAGSYEALFSKRAIKYRQRGLHEQALNEDDYRSLILEEYTFLKRPVIWTGGLQFVGNSKKTVAAAIQAIEDRD